MYPVYSLELQVWHMFGNIPKIDIRTTTAGLDAVEWNT